MVRTYYILPPSICNYLLWCVFDACQNGAKLGFRMHVTYKHHTALIILFW